MFKALVFMVRRDKSDDKELTKEEEPILFDFIYKVADEAKAPRPHRVFVSNTVNACVFYDVSVINLIFPSKKNLEIGLGLVNTLNLGEFKSILAHEFGHFTQKTMIIGRWVYIANQVAHQIISKRDILDTFIRRLSNVDIRIAWIGWLLSLVIWSIRSFSELFFKLVLLTQRALSREMEFHADLVAVSLTGSDALVNSLFKLNTADEAFDQSIEFVNKLLSKKKAVTDVYALQSNVIKQMAFVLNNSTYGTAPEVPAIGGSSFRVFKEQIAQTPKMWLTHPPNRERERNAKRVYIPAAIDERSSWILFSDPDAIKAKLTKELYKTVTAENEILSIEEGLKLHTSEFLRRFLLPKYRGVYQNRFVFGSFKGVADIYSGAEKLLLEEADFEALYPLALQKSLELLKDLEEEILMLEGLNKKALDPNEGKIRYRGREINHSDLPEVIAASRREAKAEQDKLDNHIAHCRCVHMLAAKKLGSHWDIYLMSLTKLIHYCEHSQKRVEKAAQRFGEVLSVMTSGGKVSSSELDDIIKSGGELHESLQNVFDHNETIRFNEQVCARIENRTYSELMGTYELNSPNNQNIDNWIRVVDSWVKLVVKNLIAIKEAALDELLHTEEYLEEQTLSQSAKVKEAPQAIGMPDVYFTYTEGPEKPLPERSSFFGKLQAANGTVFTLGRFAVAASIIVVAIILSSSIGSSNVMVYNGLPIGVSVHLDSKTILLEPGESEEMLIDKPDRVLVTTLTQTGDTVESFCPVLANRSKTYVYNIASAAVLYTWTAFYGYQFATPPNTEKMIGAPRWLEKEADHYFTDPPESVSLKAGATTTHDILNAYHYPADQMLPYIIDQTERENLLRAHALWDPDTSRTIVSILAAAADLKDIKTVLNKRIQMYPREVASLRMLQEVSTGDDKLKVCEQQRQLSESEPANADLYYLACRCYTNEVQKDSAFEVGQKKWPDNAWLAFATAYSYSQREEWEKALQCYTSVYKNSKVLGEIIVEDMQRIYSLMKDDSPLIEISNLDSPYLSYVREIQSSTPSTPGNKYYAFRLLANGKVKEALEFSSGDSLLNNSILILASVSKGASKEIQDKALVLCGSIELNKNSLIPAIALSCKNNLPLTHLTASIKNVFLNYQDTLFQFIDFTKVKNYQEADNLLLSMTTELKARTCLLGVLIAGQEAPEKWKFLSSKLLFINEKPYLN